MRAFKQGSNQRNEASESLNELFKRSGMDAVFGNVDIAQPVKTNDDRVDNIYSVDIGARTKSLMLWTEKGAVRHAKILDTDKAWEVQERLEEVYFHPERNAGSYGIANQSLRLLDTQDRLYYAQERIIELMSEKLSRLEIRVPRKHQADEISAALRCRQEGFSYTDIAELLGRSKHSVNHMVRKAEGRS